MKKKVLVTGGSGFIGSHVCDSLSNAGYEVYVFDKFVSKYLSNNQRMLVGDLTNIDLLKKITKNMFAVFHFAAVSDIEESNNNPLEAVKNNILATTNLLEACSFNKVKRFIFASSVYVYSKYGGFYRSTKQSCELLIESYQEINKLPFTILRFGSLYGSRANKLNWISNIIAQALNTSRIVRYGDGEEIREYIHVNDAANACIEILDKKYENKYFMITGQQAIKIKDLLKMINEIFDNKIDIKFRKKRKDYHYEITPYSYIPKIAPKFSIKCSVDLGQGILELIEKEKENK